MQQFLRESRRILTPYLNDYGLVLYSHRSTLRRNQVLFYGFNPGSDPRRQHDTRWTIEESLDNFSSGFEVLGGQANELAERLHEDCNLIDDQCWPRPSLKDNYPRGQARYQQNTRHLLRAIRHPGALITNLLFRQSARPDDMPEDRVFEDACWRVHELIFRITKPKVVVTCASVVDKALRRELNLQLVLPVQESGYKDWKCKHWKGHWQGRSIAVCQIPHMSYYNINADYSRKLDVAGWARRVVQQGILNP